MAVDGRAEMRKRTKTSRTENLRRIRLICGGAVQGVGFRPAVFRLAVKAGLSGFVKNSPEGVVIEIEGLQSDCTSFQRDLPSNLPPLASLASYSSEEMAPTGEAGFRILESESGKRSRALSPPDSVVCAECTAEMETPGDRRMNYAFTNCTDCGPRFTIISSFPYDRERTSMSRFQMCGDCLSEYREPSDRRYHAEATCCPRCGPSLVLTGPNGKTICAGDEAMDRAVCFLAEGKILAVKGLGGFQLAARADLAETVATLRKRKLRAAKPFAVMAGSLETAKKLAVLKEPDLEAISSPRGPVILAPKREPGVLELAAPGLTDLGLFLPTTPVHLGLFRNAPYDALIVTSGNATDEPIAIDNNEALERLSGIADYFLMHDRDILRRLDDSVARGGCGRPFVVRRSRGYVPVPVELGWKTPQPVLAVGAHLQNTACLVSESEAFLTPHIGDLDTARAREFLDESVRSLEALLEVEPGAVAVDMHRDYPSRWFGESLAAERGLPLLEVQHHLAHLAAVLEEHGRFPTGDGEACHGIILDGTGSGTDGTAWGGELLSIRSDLKWKRAAHIRPFPLIGNDRAVKEPWLVALALLGERAGEFTENLFERIGKKREMAELAGTSGWAMSSGAGRLFEAAGALCGLSAVNSYEGEAAALFESLAWTCLEDARTWDDMELEAENLFPAARFFNVFAEKLSAGEGKAKLAMEFHKNFSLLMAELAGRVFPPGAVVGLSGGCFVNRILRSEMKKELEKRGFTALLPYNIPPGDGGISFGQAVLASRALSAGVTIAEEKQSRRQGRQV